MKVLEEQKVANSIRPNLDIPVIIVDTGSGYNPTLKTIIEEVCVADGYMLWGKPTSL